MNRETGRKNNACTGRQDNTSTEKSAERGRHEHRDMDKENETQKRDMVEERNTNRDTYRRNQT